MTEKRFEQLVRELEGYAEAHPAQYKLKVALLAFSGYAYVFAVLGAVIALTVSCFVLIKDGSSGHALLFKVGIALIVLATVIVRALWVRLEPPTGIELQREHAPRLFLLIDKIRNALGTPAFHHLLIVNELNAAVVQVPRLRHLRLATQLSVTGTSAPAHPYPSPVSRGAGTRVRPSWEPTRPLLYLDLSRPRDLVAAAPGNDRTPTLGVVRVYEVSGMVRAVLQCLFVRHGPRARV